jgi:hypothetical protein
MADAQRVDPQGFRARPIEPARYQVRQVQRRTGPYGKPIWKITFQRVGAPRETVDLTVHSVIFSGMDLDAEYTAEDLVRLRDAGGR